MSRAKKKRFNISFIAVAGACMAVAVTIAIYLATGALVPQPNILAAK